MSPIKAAQYARLASKNAEKTASINEAIALAIKGIACLEKAPATEELTTKIIDARTLLGLYMIQMQKLSEAKKIIDPIIHSAEDRNYKKRLSQIYGIRGAHEYWLTEDITKAREYLGKSLALANELGDVVSLFFASLHLAYMLAWNCDFEEAFSHIKRAADINIRAKSVWGLAVVKSHESSMHSLRGDVEMSCRTSEEAVSLAEESGDLYSTSHAYAVGGVSFYSKGFFQEAVRHLVKGAGLCERTNLPIYVAWADWVLAETYFECRDYERAKSCYLKAAGLFEEDRVFPSWMNLCRAGMARAKAANQETGIDLESLYFYPRQNRLKAYEGLLSGYLGEVLLSMDHKHFPEAQHWIEKSIEADERNGTRLSLARDHAVYAQLFKRKGETFEAKEQLGKAIDIYKECGADGWVTRAEEEMARLC